jgi:AcrR family transcriptional regulator
VDRERTSAASTGRKRSVGSETRERIMDVAETHLGGGGYLGVSLEEVAREVGVSKPALYYHFPHGKEELFVAIAQRALAHHREGLEGAIAAHDSGAAKLRAVARWLMSESNQDHPMDELRDLSRFVSEQHQRDLAEGFFGSLYGPIHRAISLAVESGEFSENCSELLTWAFLSLLSGMLQVENVPAGPTLPEATRTAEGMAERTVDLFLNGVLP